MCVREAFIWNERWSFKQAHHLVEWCVAGAARLCVWVFIACIMWCAVGGGTGRNQGRGGGETAAADERSSEADRRVVFPVWRCWSHVEEVEGRPRKAASSPSPWNGFYLLSPRKMCTPCCISQVSNNRLLHFVFSVGCERSSRLGPLLLPSVCCFYRDLLSGVFDVVLVFDTHASDLFFFFFFFFFFFHVS